MPSVKQSALKSIYVTFPGAYFINDNIVSTIEPSFIDQLFPADIYNAQRIESALRWRLNEAYRRLKDDRAQILVRPVEQFNFLTPKELRATVGATSFLCKKCGSIFNLREKIRSGRLSEQDLLCSVCKTRLSPIVQFLVHASCGTVLELADNIPRCPSCQRTLRLRISSVSFSNSRWFCERGCPLPPYLADPVGMCPTCKGLNDEARKMKPIPAPRVVRPVGIKMVDVGSASTWQEIIAARLQSEAPDILSLILEEVPDPYKDSVRKDWLSNEETRERLRQQYISKHPEIAQREEDLIRRIGGEPPLEIQRLLAEYKGVWDAGKQSPNVLSAEKAAYLKNRFGISISYVRSIRIQNIVYGRQYGGSNVDKCIIRPFRNTKGKLVALTHGVETEGILFEFDISKLTKWLSTKHSREIDEAGLNTILLRVPGDDPSADLIARDVLYLTHTFSHLILRESEIHTGYSRDNLSEIIFSPLGAFAIIADEGNELGVLETACRSDNITSWVLASKRNAETCVLDPVCNRGEITGVAACHSCCFVGERNCNCYWNDFLDRRIACDYFASFRTLPTAN